MDDIFAIFVDAREVVVFDDSFAVDLLSISLFDGTFRLIDASLDVILQSVLLGANHRDGVDCVVFFIPILRYVPPEYDGRYVDGDTSKPNRDVCPASNDVFDPSSLDEY